MKFTITGKIKPYVRMTQRGKWVKPQAQEYLASKEAIRWQLRQQMAGKEMLPERTPLEVRLSFTVTTLHKCDLDNLIKSAIDSAQSIIFKDDRWVDAIAATRQKGSENIAILEVKIRAHGSDSEI